MDKLVLLDSNSLLNRAFYALPPMTSVDGVPTNAVYGYLNMLIKIIGEIKPSHIIATFDLKAPTFRKQMYSDYKAQRKPMPEELAQQIPLLKGLLAAMGIQIIEKEGYEADDIIGTLARKCPFDTVIVTGDRDSLQLVSDTTTVWLTKRGISEVIKYDLARLAEDGLTPKGVVDLKSLMGDQSDNIPGVAGVGEKTAKSLLNSYGDLDGVYANIDSITGKLKDKLIAGKDMAYLSYQLATINQYSPVEFNKKQCRLLTPFGSRVKDILIDLNFKSLLNKIPCSDGIQVMREDGENTSKLSAVTVMIRNMTEFNKLVSKIYAAGKVAIYIDSRVCLSTGDGVEYVVEMTENLLDCGLKLEEISQILRNIFEDSGVLKIGYDIKTLMRQLEVDKITEYEDVLLKVYLLDSNRNYKSFEDVRLDYKYDTDCNASILYNMNYELDTMLKDADLYTLYTDIERPLVSVLYRMENAGCRIDMNLLSELRIKYIQELEELTEKIYEYNDGEKFNINSSIQLGTLLFDKLGLKHGRKNKNGYSTDVEVLKSIQNDSPVVPLVLRYRELNKLLSTYIDGMGGLVRDGRVHTVFRQTVTATGRLSSTEPNLQNIPVRRAEGRELRKLFVASDGCKIVCADYSQIELRLLAHMSEDPVLIEAFNNDYDIHSATASLVFGVPMDAVGGDMRRQAKAVNFGIIYGISAFGLSNDLGISPTYARRFIDKYFETYPKVKGYMDNCIAKAKEQGYVSTLMGRRRLIPELKSSNYNIRSFGERVAMNMPLQGSASDIIKKAMIDVDKAICDGGYKAKLILQVHDELLIDCPEGEVDAVSEILRKAMENVVELKVKLVADVSVGDNWYEAK